METGAIIIIVLIVAFIALAVNFSYDKPSNKQTIEELRNKLVLTSNQKTETETANNMLIKELEKLKKRVAGEEKWKEEQNRFKTAMFYELDTYLQDKAEAYKWLAPLVSDIKLLITERDRKPDELINTARPYSTQARVSILLDEKHHLETQNAVLNYQLEYIRTLLPSVDDIIEYDEFKFDKEYHTFKFLTREEYMTLSDSEKNKRALEYYKNRKRNNWEIGRDFEMFVGYYYWENQGFDVTYYGIEKKLNDLGRDLIVKDKERTAVVQCKYWSKDKLIHEKHLAQLYGTFIMYKIEHPQERIILPVFFTHTKLSDEARRFAKELNIKVFENIEIGDYPMIKCNKSSMIYHLPVDQQYDRTIINKKAGDFMAFTIDEAEQAGFRRAYKWHGN